MQPMSNELGKRMLSIVAGEHACNCGKPSDGPRSCPYQGEINDNYEIYCECCDDCAQECAYDV